MFKERPIVIIAYVVCTVMAVLAVTLLYQFMLRRDPALGSQASRHRAATAAVAMASMLLWTGIIFAGRWIAYYS